MLSYWFSNFIRRKFSCKYFCFSIRSIWEIEKISDLEPKSLNQIDSEKMKKKTETNIELCNVLMPDVLRSLTSNDRSEIQMKFVPKFVFDIFQFFSSLFILYSKILFKCFSTFDVSNSSKLRSLSTKFNQNSFLSPI